MKFIQSLLLLLCCQFSFSDSGLTPIVKVNKQSSLSFSLPNVGEIAIWLNQKECFNALCDTSLRVDWKVKGKSSSQKLLESSYLPIDKILVDKNGVIIRSFGNRFHPEGYRHYVRYRYSQEKNIFYKSETWETDNWSGYVAKVDHLLKTGAFDQARELINEKGTSPNAGHTDNSKEFFAKFVNAIYREAKRAKKLGYDQVAGQLVNSLLIDMPFQYEKEGNAPDNTYVFMKPAKQGGFNLIDITKENTYLVNELAVFLREGGYHNEALELIKQIKSEK